MPLFLDRDVDRVLTSEEVQILLTEDAAGVVEDSDETTECTQIIERWNLFLMECWRSKEFCDRATDKIRVKVWKEEQTYFFQTKDKKQICKRSLCGKVYGYRCITEISYLTAIPGQSQLEGMSIAEIEEISARFFLKDSVIKCLLDAGFTLKLIVPRDFLAL